MKINLETMEKQFLGEWLFIKTADHYGDPDIIEFNNNTINHFGLEKNDGISLNKIARNWIEKLTDLNIQFKNPNRIRILRKGKVYKVLSDNESITEDCIFEDNYEKLIPTETKLSEDEIQNLKFEFIWNNEKMTITFNEILDKPYMQKINKKLNKQGHRIVLGNLNETLFLSIYDDIYIQNLLPIKYVDNTKIILYGFPKEPYEITCNVI